MGCRALSSPLSCFSRLFFRLRKKESKPVCLQSRLIIAERLAAGAPCVYFSHVCPWLPAHFAAGAAALESMWERVCFLRGCYRWSGRVGGGGGDAWGEERHPHPPMAHVVVCSEPLPR